VVIDDDVVAQVQVSEATSLVEVQCFGTREPRNGAAAMMSRLLSRLSLPIARDIFERFGLTLNPVGAPASIDALSGPQWESRSALTLQVTQVQLAAEPVEVVEVVRGTIEARSELPVVYEIPFESEV
jgi:hypothetical protein